MGQFNEQWAFYIITVGEDLAFMLPNVAVHDDAPMPAYPHALRIRIALAEPDDRGLITTDEFRVIKPFGEALSATLAHLPAAGVSTYGGMRHWHYYTDDVDRDSDSVREAASKVIPQYEVHCEHYEDREWREYFDFLYPNALAWQFIKDDQLLDSMRTSGDDGTRERPIDHWAVFPTEAAREAYAAELPQLGYEVLNRSRGEADADEPYMLQFRTLADMAPADIHSFTERLSLNATECGGTYDGWEVPLLGTDAQDG